MNLQMFNYALFSSSPFIMKWLTERNHTALCVVYGAILMEYVACMGDKTMMFDSFIAIAAYVNIKGMILDFYKHAKFIVVSSLR